MFHFSEPIWLLGIAGIVIPVIIHLWNIRQGKTLKVGSIALLRERSRQNARSLRLSELLLLLLRCLFIILLAMLLAGPAWRERPDYQKTKGWVLLEPGRVSETYAVFKPRIDSMLLSGYELHYFEQGFQRAALDKALASRPDSAGQDTLSYWSLLQLLQQAVPARLNLQLFTTNNLHRFAGERPEIDLDLTWHSFTPADSVFSKTVAAYQTASDSIQVVKFTSSPSGNSYSNRSISAIARPDSEYAVSIENGKLMLGDLKDSTSVEVDTSTIRLNIFADKFPQDGNYLKAALQAIQQYSTRRIEVKSINKISETGQPVEWLFWLSESPLPLGLKTKNVFKYAVGKPENINSSITGTNISLNTDPLALYKFIRADSTKELITTAYLKNGYGQPLLGKVRDEGKNLYTFYSRFDPEWNELVWSENFPAILLNLVLDKAVVSKASRFADKRIINTEQLQPARNEQAQAERTATPAVNRDLSPFSWLAAFLVFLLERIVSFYQKKKENYA